jgi:hypothetical protein
LLCRAPGIGRPHAQEACAMLSTRRLFLGSAIAAAVPLVIRGDAHAIAAGLAPSSPAPIADPVLAELHRQLEELKQLAAAPAPRMGEIMRRHAANLRLRAAHGKATQLDAKVRRQLKALVDAKGRDAFPRNPNDVDVAAREAAVDQLLRSGITPTWLAIAAQLEQIAAKADLRGPLHPVRRQLEDPCEAMERGERLLEMTVAALCVLSLVLGPEFCIIAEIDLLVWRAYMFYMGC